MSYRVDEAMLSNFFWHGTVKKSKGPLAADTRKLTPGLDFRGDPALDVLPQTALRHLFCEAVDKELGRLWVV